VATEPATGREGSLWSATPAREHSRPWGAEGRPMVGQPAGCAPGFPRQLIAEQSPSSGSRTLGHNTATPASTQPSCRAQARTSTTGGSLARQQLSAMEGPQEPLIWQPVGSQPKDSTGADQVPTTQTSAQGLQRRQNSRKPTHLNRNAPAPTAPPRGGRRRCRVRSAGSPAPPGSPAVPAAPPPATPLAGSGRSRRSARRRTAPAGG
jgi:hypothetical protein